MPHFQHERLRLLAVHACLSVTLLAAPAAAHAQGALAGVVIDALGTRVPGTRVALAEGPTPSSIEADADGRFLFSDLATGRYRVTASAPGFAPTTTDTVFVSSGQRATLTITLHVGPLQQAVTVTASAQQVPASQTGAAVTVLDRAVIDRLNKPDLHETLRLVPGAHVHQTGARGGQSAIFVRGGNPSFTKVLFDGVAVNDLGGLFDFAPFQTTGTERVEVLRQSNSVIHGSDALAGVINIETRRGRTRLPQAGYTLDGGNLGTLRSSASIGGAIGRVDYFSEYSRFTTDNNVPNARYRNGTYAGRFSVALGRATDLSGTVRHIDASAGSPNAVALFGVADDSSSDAQLLYGSVTARSQWTDRWQSTIRFGSTGQSTQFLNPTPTGQPFDPFGFGANYLGRTVTVRGANGYSVTGRAILDYGGSYPQPFDAKFTRRQLFGQTTYRVAGDLHFSLGARYEREQAYSDPTSDPDVTRNNGGMFVEGRGSIGARLHVSAGLGVERNAVFNTAVTPRLSVAAYLRQPSQGVFGDTKLVVNAGKGIKAMSPFQQQNSLQALLASAPAGPRPAVEALGPERSTSMDVGIEQALAAGHGRVRLSYYRNRFSDLIEYVGKSALPLVGVPASVAQATSFGAYVNSSSFDAQGVELSAEAVAGPVRMLAAYLFLDAEVTKSFTGGALAPAVNPAFPGIPIGQFAPLVGARPFRRPTHSGSAMVGYVRGPFDAAVSAYFSGTRDGSTFLTDPFFGSSMLLPNENLEAAFQKVDVSAGYRLNRHLRGFISIENVLDRAYQASFGFPSLPLTARGGVTVDLGGR